MATARRVHLTVDDIGVFKFKPQTAETAARTSELLQENHDKHHIFFNQSGFHNHIAHHLLSLYGLGAPASVIEKQYKANLSYQRAAIPVQERVVQDMTSPEHFKKYLGKEKYYHDFLIFWQDLMEEKGWENILNEYVFAGDERADDMLCRLYAGFLHPLIHLGFGIEFNQPAIIAEALAQASVHDTWVTPYLLKCEASAPSTPTSKTLPELIDEIRSNKKLVDSVHWDDGNKIRDGILKRAPDEMIDIAKQWTVQPDELEEKTAEMINAAVYFTAAAQHPPKQIKFDFFYMHSVNSSLFFPLFASLPWLSAPSKSRLLRFKAYIDLAMYCSRGSPPLLLDEISNYVPKSATRGGQGWEDVLERLCEVPDDGHAVKLGRAVRVAEGVCEGFEGRGGEGKVVEGEGKGKWRVKGAMWEKIGNMVVDSVEGSEGGERWVRNAGFERAWEGFADRPGKASL